jgi:hypothetical protein
VTLVTLATLSPASLTLVAHPRRSPRLERGRPEGIDERVERRVSRATLASPGRDFPGAIFRRSFQRPSIETHRCDAAKRAAERQRSVVHPKHVFRARYRATDRANGTANRGADARVGDGGDGGAAEWGAVLPAPP